MLNHSTPEPTHAVQTPTRVVQTLHPAWIRPRVLREPAGHRAEPLPLSLLVSLSFPAPSSAPACGCLAASWVSASQMFSVKHSDALFPLLAPAATTFSRLGQIDKATAEGKLSCITPPWEVFTFLPVFESAHFLYLLMRVPIDQ